MEGVIECIIGVFIGMVIASIIFGVFIYEPRISSLGQSICEEEYGLDFEFYDGNVLHCKPMIETEEYDGIKVQIGEEENEHMEKGCGFGKEVK